MKKSKDVEIKARVTRAMRNEIKSLANQRGETISLIVREAIREYLAKYSKWKAVTLLCECSLIYWTKQSAAPPKMAAACPITSRTWSAAIWNGPWKNPMEKPNDKIPRKARKEHKQRIDLTIRPEILEKAQTLADEQYRSLSNLVEYLIATEYERTRPHKPPEAATWISSFHAAACAWLAAVLELTFSNRVASPERYNRGQKARQ
jgi:hypothetical protein